MRAYRSVFFLIGAFLNGVLMTNHTIPLWMAVMISAALGYFIDKRRS